MNHDEVKHAGSFRASGSRSKRTMIEMLGSVFAKQKLFFGSRSTNMLEISGLLGSSKAGSFRLVGSRSTRLLDIFGC